MRRLVDLTPRQHVAMGAVQQAPDPIHVPRVDDTRERLVCPLLAGRGAKPHLEHALTLAHELALDVAVHEHVIGRDTRLPHVEHKLPPHDLGGRPRDVCAGRVDVGRGLAAQLQRARGQVLGRGLQHDAPHGAIARVHDVVKLLLEQRRRLRDGAQDAPDGRAVQVPVDELADERGRVRGDLGGLDHAAVACGEDGDERVEHHRDRVVPRRDQQHDALRLGPHEGLTEHGRRRRRGPIRGPVVQVLQRHARVRRGTLEVEEPADLGRVLVVGADCRRDLEVVLLEHPQDRLQLLPAPRQRARAPRSERGAQRGHLAAHGLRQLCGGRRGPPHGVPPHRRQARRCRERRRTTLLAHASCCWLSITCKI